MADKNYYRIKFDSMQPGQYLYFFAGTPLQAKILAQADRINEGLQFVNIISLEVATGRLTAGKEWEKIKKAEYK